MIPMVLGVYLAAAGMCSGAAAADAGDRFAAAWPQTDFTTATVDLDEIVDGGPGKDGIPAIDAPSTVPVAAAGDWLAPDEPVVLVRTARQVRAYPLQILIWHEIVNDRLGGVPLAVTFCPLCNAAIVFERRVSGRELDFGTTGLLRHSDLVMYDRQTQSWWQQFSGEAIAGEFAGTRLRALPASIVSFADVAKRFPGADVLSRRTGFRRDYGHNPYPGYDRVGQRPFLLDTGVDPRLPAMERVLAVRIGDRYRLYPFSRLRESPLVHDRVGGTEVVVIALDTVRSALDAPRIAQSRQVLSANAFDRRVDGRTLVFERAGDMLKDRATGSIWNRYGEAVSGPLAGKSLRHLSGSAHFAFAWLVFEPDASIWSSPPD